MGDSAATDKFKGRVKQAAGDLTGDEDLEREGEVDETSGEVREKVDRAKDKVNDVIDDVKEKTTN